MVPPEQFLGIITRPVIIDPQLLVQMSHHFGVVILTRNDCIDSSSVLLANRNITVGYAHPVSPSVITYNVLSSINIFDSVISSKLAAALKGNKFSDTRDYSNDGVYSVP